MRRKGKFTAVLAVGQKPDPQVIVQLNEKLLDRDQRVDLFDIGLDDGDRHVLKDLQQALANIKLEVARSASKNDLPYVTGSV
jgi:hypothetical protein